jgi:hypothetical protein
MVCDSVESLILNSNCNMKINLNRCSPGPDRTVDPEVAGEESGPGEVQKFFLNLKKEQLEELLMRVKVRSETGADICKYGFKTSQSLPGSSLSISKKND